MLFQDEARYGRINDGRRCWGPLPLRPRVPSQIVREYVYAYGAVSPSDGQFVSLILPWVDASLMSLFLAHVADSFPGEHCAICLDGAGWHKASDLVVPASVTPIFLPPYSPELNPVEHIWKYTRENDFRNHLCHSMTEVMDILERSLHHLGNDPHLVRSMTHFDWINTLP
ncbi:MAG: IS630 family transposase [Acidobacteriota bacterium]